MTAGDVAALVAAIAFALLVIVGGYVLVRLARLISEATGLISEVRGRSDELLDQAGQAMDRAHEQLARTDAIGANLDLINNNLAELTGDISIMTRALRAMLSGPVGRVAAFSFGIRRAIGLRRGEVQVAQQFAEQELAEQELAEQDFPEPDERPALPAGRSGR